jgi:hypothetical protein
VHQEFRFVFGKSIKLEGLWILAFAHDALKRRANIGFWQHG